MRMDQKSAKQHLLPIFTAKVLRELLVFGDSHRVTCARRALEAASLIQRGTPMRQLFEDAYSVLLEVYPAEYILINECLCAQVSDTDEVSAYREQAVGGSKADLSLFWSNGRSRGYEIKSRFDRLDRLQNQLWTYQQVFFQSYVVTDKSHIPRVLEDSPVSVGVLSISSSGIEEIRSAKEAPDRLHLGRLFSTLRKGEYLKLIRAEFGSVPEVPNTQIYRTCLELFQQLDRRKANSLVTEALSRRQAQPPLRKNRARRLPRSLRALALTGSLTQPDLLRLSYLLER